MARAKRGNNEGSIYQRSDGRWVSAVTIADGGGSRKRKYIYGKTRQEVARKLTETLKSVQDNAPLPPDRLTVGGFAKEWLESVKPSLRFKTVESYETALRIHVIPKLGHIRLARLAASDLERLYADLIGKGASPKSVLNYHRCIHAMLEKAVRWGILARNVAKLASLPRQVRHELPMVTPTQARAFLQATREHRLEALFVLAITTGARQGELLGLAWDRVHLDEGFIEVRQALQKQNGHPTLVEPKTSRSIRSIALTGMAVDALRRHWVNQMKEALYLGPI
jgi:integrase